MITLDAAGDVQLAPGSLDAPTRPANRGRRDKRPYEGTDNAREAMQAYLGWEYGLVPQLERDGTHGFTILS